MAYARLAPPGTGRARESLDGGANERESARSLPVGEEKTKKESFVALRILLLHSGE